MPPPPTPKTPASVLAKVSVPPEPVTVVDAVSPLNAVDDVAIKMVDPVCVCPTGPMALTVHTPLIAKHPDVMCTPTFEVVVADAEIFKPETVVVPNPSPATERNFVAFDEEATSKTGLDCAAAAWIAAVAYGEDVPTPNFDPVKTKFAFEASVSAAVVYNTVFVPPKVVRPVPPFATARVPVMVESVVVATHAGTPPESASTKPFVDAASLDSVLVFDA